MVQWCEKKDIKIHTMKYWIRKQMPVSKEKPETAWVSCVVEEPVRDTITLKIKNVEKDAKELLKIRQKDSQPVLDAYLAWLNEQKEIIAPQSATGKAISYSLNQWYKLTSLMKGGRIEIDNNRADFVEK